MKIKTKEKYLILLIILFLLVTIFYIKNYTGKNGEVLKSEKVQFTNKRISLMIETDYESGEYTESGDIKWPDKYIFNSELSTCEHGSKLTWNNDSKTITLKTNISDKCYVYFDAPLPPDININISNTSLIMGNPADLTCNGSTSTWNYMYNRLEINALDKSFTNCNLNFSEKPEKEYLNNYIIGLEGTTQGSGEIIHEEFNKGDYSSSTSLTETNYLNVSQYSATSNTATSGTTASAYSFANNNWISNISTMESATFYHFQFNVPSEGYYQICYNISTGFSSNNYYFYKNNNQLYINGENSLAASTSISKSGCHDLGYLTTTDTLRVVQRAYSNTTYPIASISFNVIPASKIQKIDAGYRYEGKNPNNYVWFNNELWRIIGVFDESTHGIKDQQLVKIARAELIGHLDWDKSNINDWSTSSLNSLLNETYYNALDGNGNDYCYGSTDKISANCDYRESGIKVNYRKMIKKTTWYLGGPFSYFATPIEIYNYERSSLVYNDRPTSTEAYIGLIYPSDYGYSAPESSCSRTTSMVYYGNSNCSGQSWIYGSGEEWFITPVSNSSTKAFSISDSSGSFTNYQAVNSGSGVRPVLYLDSNVFRLEGDGSILNPFIVGI